MYRNDSPGRRDRSSGIVVTLAHVLSVGAVCVAEPTRRSPAPSTM
ncbi:hypothetical protein ACIBCU_23375 [Streptomyces sp. NPDC051064]